MCVHVIIIISIEIYSVKLKNMREYVYIKMNTHLYLFTHSIYI